MKNWFKNAEGQVRSGWKVLLAFGLMTIITGIFSIPVTLIMILTGGKGTPMETLMNNPVSDFFLMLAQVLGVIFSIFICLRMERKKWSDIGVTSLRNQRNNLLFGLILGAASMVFITLIMMDTGQITISPAKVTPKLLMVIGMYFVGFLFVAINEEFFFRGYVVTTLKQTKSYPIIYLGSCLLFGLAHLGNPNVHILGIINICLIGLLFAYMFIQTKSLWMTLGYHFTWNFFQGNVIGFNVSGTEGNGFFHIKSADNIWTGGTFGVEASVWTTVFILIGFLLTKFFYGRDYTTKKEEV